MSAGTRLLPSLARGEARLFAGVRAATPDGLPLIGASTEPRVILAAGARRNGWLLAPLAARVVAAAATGAPAGPHARRFDPGRFGDQRSL